jgi:hypothetical protein
MNKPQKQISLQEQLIIIAHLANKEGCYDAADFLRNILNNQLPGEPQLDLNESTKKYELTGETKVTLNGVVLHRIKALKDFVCQGFQVNKGDLGGWIEREINLAQEGNCWVFGNAGVYGKARVSGNARVSEGEITE